MTTAHRGGSRPLPDLQKSGLKEVWQHRLPLLPGERVVNVWRVGDSIYVTTSEAHVLRLVAGDGTLKWQLDLGDKQCPIFRPSDTPAGKSVLIVNRGKGFLVDKQTGEV